MLEVLGTIAERAPWLLDGMLATAPKLAKLEPIAPVRKGQAERLAAQAEMRRRWDAGELDDHIGTLDDDEYKAYRDSIWG